jgi:hypothetical protein
MRTLRCLRLPLNKLCCAQRRTLPKAVGLHVRAESLGARWLGRQVHTTF